MKTRFNLGVPTDTLHLHRVAHQTCMLRDMHIRQTEQTGKALGLHKADGTNGKGRGCSHGKRQSRRGVHFVLNSCPLPHKNANFDTMRIEVSVFILHTPAVKRS